MYKGEDSLKNTVIFDLDGLLINCEMITYQLYRDLIEKYNQHISLEEYVHDYCGNTGGIFCRNRCNLHT